MALTELMKKTNGERTPDIFRGFSNIFDEFFRNELMTRDISGFVPAVNIGEDNDNYFVEIAAPGYSKEDFKVEMVDHMLSISAERQKEESEEQKNYSRKEFTYGSFKRTLSMPETVNEEDIHAKYQDGVLKLTLPKKEESKAKPPKEIDIE